MELYKKNDEEDIFVKKDRVLYLANLVTEIYIKRSIRRNDRKAWTLLMFVVCALDDRFYPRKFNVRSTKLKPSQPAASICFT